MPIGSYWGEFGTQTSVNTGGGGGSGTVTSVSVISANGLAGSVATPTTTPAITLSTTITGILKGNGTAISAAVSGTDYPAVGVITAGGPTGGATTVPIITWNANGQLTAVTSTTITGTVPGGSASGDLSGSYPGPTVIKINGTQLSSLATGLLKNTTGTGVPTIAVAGTDYPATGVIVAGGPTGTTTAAPTVTWNANGQLTAVSTTTIASVPRVWR